LIPFQNIHGLKNQNIRGLKKADLEHPGVEAAASLFISGLFLVSSEGIRGFWSGVPSSRTCEDYHNEPEHPGVDGLFHVGGLNLEHLWVGCCGVNPFGGNIALSLMMVAIHPLGGNIELLIVLVWFLRGVRVRGLGDLALGLLEFVG